MTSTTFVPFTTKIESTWLQDVNDHAYDLSATAHDADKISLASIAGLTSTDVQSAIAELYSGMGGDVNSVNGKTGTVVLTAADIADVYSKNEVDTLVGGGGITSINGDTGPAVVLTHVEVGAAPSSHNHDDRYYTETEADALFLTESQGDNRYARTSINETFDGDVTVNGYLNVNTDSANNNSFVRFWDQNSSSWRGIRWNNDSNEFQAEANDGSFYTMVHAGNAGSYAGGVTDAVAVDTQSAQTLTSGGITIETASINVGPSGRVYIMCNIWASTNLGSYPGYSVSTSSTYTISMTGTGSTTGKTFTTSHGSAGRIYRSLMLGHTFTGVTPGSQTVTVTGSATSGGYQSGRADAISLLVITE